MQKALFLKMHHLGEQRK